MRSGSLVVWTFCGCALAFAFPVHVFAEIVLSYKLAEAPHLATHWVMTLTAHSLDPTEAITGFDFGHRDGRTPATDFGIFAPMNQVNPFGVPTVFQDANATFASVGAFVDQDSQFLFSTQSSPAPLVLPGPQEGSSSLQAAFIFSDGLGLSVPFAQIIIRGGTLNFRGAIYVIKNGVSSERPIEGGFFHIPLRVPEPGTAVLVAGMILGIVPSMRRRLCASSQRDCSISRLVSRWTHVTRRRRMNRAGLTALLLVLGLACSSPAAVIISAGAGVDTPGLPGYTTYQLSATSDNGGITALDFVGDGSVVGPNVKGASLAR